jgi:hypothetical protein
MEWISVKDEYPDRGVPVLVCADNGYMGVLCYFGTEVGGRVDVWREDEWACSASCTITHWKALPAPPNS